MCYTTILEENKTYADYCDISTGQAMLATALIPGNLCEISVGKALEFTGTVAMTVGAATKLFGGMVRKSGEKRLDRNKKTVESYIRMR